MKIWLLLFDRSQNCIKPSNDNTKHDFTPPASINNSNTRFNGEIHFNYTLRRHKLRPSNIAKTNKSFNEKEFNIPKTNLIYKGNMT